MNKETDLARSIAAVFAGFIFFMIFWAILFWLTGKLVAPGILDGTLRTGTSSLLVVLIPAVIAPFAAGYLTGMAAGRAPVIHAIPLSIFLLGTSILRLRQSQGQIPLWYLICFLGLTTLAPLAGGFLRK